MRKLSSFCADRRQQFIFLALSFIYAICLVWGRDIMFADTVYFRSSYVWFRIFLYFVLSDIALNICFLVWKLIGPKIIPLIKIKYIEMSDRKLFICVFISIIICWLPTYITCWPGLGIYDGPGQVNNISTHHPVMHTLLIQLCNALAKQFGWVSWLFPYTVIQFLFMAFAFSYLIVTLKHWKIPRIIIVMISVWFCIFPMHALMALASTKDSMFSGFFVLFICSLGDLFLSNADSVTKNWYIRYWIICFLLCAFRNNGVYVLFCTIPFMILIANSKKAILLSLSVILAYFVYQGPVMNMFGVEQGDIREAMSIIIQPLSRTYNEKQGELSEEERNAIVYLFGDQSPWYVSHISDAAKSQFNSTTFFSELKYYSKLYIKLGLRYPDSYLDAILANTYGNWYPHEILPDPTAYRMYFEFPTESAEEYGSIWPSYYEFLQNLSRESSYLQVPFVYILFCTGIVFWEILFLLMCIIGRREYKKIVIFVPFIALWITIMLGPVALLRYTYPLMVGLPLLGCITFIDFPNEIIP